MYFIEYSSANNNINYNGFKGFRFYLFPNLVSLSLSIFNIKLRFVLNWQLGMQNFIKGIPEWEHMTDIFKKVDCRCDDAIEIINSYIDDDKVLFYLDSPYIATTQYDEAYSDKNDDKKDETDNKKNDEAPDKEENTADEEYVAETPNEEAPDEEDIDDDEMSLGDFTKMRDALKKCKGKNS